MISNGMVHLRPSQSSNLTSIPKAIQVRTRSTTTRDRNLQFRGAVSTGFFEFYPLDFSLFSRFTVYFSKEIAPKCGEICLISGRRKKCRILLHLWLSWFFLGPQQGISSKTLLDLEGDRLGTSNLLSPKSGKPRNSIFRVPKYLFSGRSWDPFKWPCWGICSSPPPRELLYEGGIKRVPRSA